jgi:Abortive infection C-terminus
LHWTHRFAIHTVLGGVTMAKLTNPEIMRLVTRYIGVFGGYLGSSEIDRFSYQSHADFYPQYCNLDIDPNAYQGTTRQRFIKVLGGAAPSDQAKILRGILERFPAEGHASRLEMQDEIVTWIHRLEAGAPVGQPVLQTTSEAVERAIADAEVLITSTGAPSSVDRVHTALHAHLIAVCMKATIPYEGDAGMTVLFKLVREHHAAFKDLGPRAADMTQVLRACATILDALGPVRNRASGAHPNSSVLPPAEAMLVVNVARTLLHYFDSKLS